MLEEGTAEKSNKEPQIPRQAAPETSEPKKFSLEVDIDGLPYIFKGNIPDEPDDINLSLHLPNWEEELEKIYQKIREDKMFPGAEVTSFKFDQGEIGFVHAVPPSDVEADLYIERIRSNTWIVPKESPYYDVQGLGRFLMNNLLTLADLKGWSVTAFPYTDGRMTHLDVLEWLNRKGFDYKKGHLVREPQQPDMTQAITQVIK